MDILGIDIGTVSIKYVRCRGTTGKSIIVSKGDYPYKGIIEDLVPVLSEIRNKEGPDVQVVAGISSPEIIKKTLTIPILPKKEQKEALNWISAKNTSTSLDELIYEHLIIGQIEEKSTMKDEVLFVGVHKSFVERVLLAFRQSGFQHILNFTDIAFGYAYALNESGDRSAAVVDVGGNRTGLYIIRGRRLMLAREVLTASTSFSDALMSGPALTVDEAEQYKRERGFDEELTEILKAPFARLVGEIQRTFIVYNEKYPEKPVANVYVAGRGADIPKFYENLEDALVEEVNHLQSGNGVQEKYIPAHALCMNVEALPNLLPESAKTREQEKIYKRYISIGAVVLAGILFLVSLGMWGSLRNRDTELSGETKALEKMKSGIQSLSLKNKSSLVASDVNFINEELQKKDVTFITLLKYLSSRTPENIHLKSIEFGEYTGTDLQPEADEMKTTATQGQTGQKSRAGQVPEGAKGKVSTSTNANLYPVTLKGYASGEPRNHELALFNFVLRLRQSGFLSDVEMTGREPASIKGQQMTQFVITARCVKHEI